MRGLVMLVGRARFELATNGLKARKTTHNWGLCKKLLASETFIYSFTKTTPQLKEIKNNRNY